MLKLIDKNIDLNYVVPENEKERQAKLNEYDILDTLPEEDFDALVELAAIITDCPISYMNILDHDRQWTKAAYGSKPGRSIPRSNSACQYTVMEDGFFEIEDFTKDDRFKNMPYVVNEPKLRSYHGYPITTEDGFKLGALCVLDTQPKKLIPTQRKALKTLANEIMARLELRKKHHELEQLNKEKDQFLRVVNHDIKSPINGIVSSAHYLQNLWDGDRDELLTMLSMIELSGRKLINYTSELMENSLAQNESKLHLDEENVEELINDLIDIYKPLSKAKNIQLTLNCDVQNTFRLDNEKFKLILSNLISNAIKFSKMGDSVEINVNQFSSNEEHGQSMLHISVKDTGIGIPRDFLPTLFIRSKKHQRQGTQGEISTGIGLPLVKKFIELHDGGIKVDTEEGKGTTFHVVLPEQKAAK